MLGNKGHATLGTPTLWALHVCEVDLVLQLAYTYVPTLAGIVQTGHKFLGNVFSLPPHTIYRQSRTVSASTVTPAGFRFFMNDSLVEGRRHLISALK